MEKDPDTSAAARGSRKAESGSRFAIGKYWLWFRRDRNDWAMCWLDGRTIRRRSLGIGGGAPDHAPPEACKALIDHYIEETLSERSKDRRAAGDPAHVMVADITARWLTDHVVSLGAPGRYAHSALVLERFYEHQRSLGQMPDPYVVTSVSPAFVRAFIKFRLASGVSAPTISRDLRALRAPLNWAVTEGLLTCAPRIGDVKGKNKVRDLVYSPQQIAAILDAAGRFPTRRHLLLYLIAFLSTMGRSQAILELDVREQVRDGLIYFNAAGRDQTSKRRSIVPIAPTLAPWIESETGKLIIFRRPSSPRRVARGDPPVFEVPVFGIYQSFGKALVEAGARYPELQLSRQAVDKAGAPIWILPRGNESELSRRPKMVGIGTPNTMRHSIHTFLASRGVPKAQIDTAAGHATDVGTGDRYNHLRPAYLKEFISGIEEFWREVDRYTDVHRIVK